MDADDATVGQLRLWVGGRLIWGRPSVGVDWIWRDLLQGLTLNWAKLLFEDWLEPSVVGSLREAREAMAVSLGLKAHELDEQELTECEQSAYDWAEAHELSRYLPGVMVPEVFVRGTPAGVEFSTDQRSLIVPRALAMEALGQLGDAIASRLVDAGFGDDPLVADWRARIVLPTDEFAAGSSGCLPSVLCYARGETSEGDAWGDEAGVMDETPYVAVARACRAVGRHSLREAFSILRSAPPPGEAWEEVSAHAAGAARLPESDVSSIVRMVADRLRGDAGLRRSDPFSPGKVALAAGIDVREVSWEERGFAGLCIFAPAKAPLVIVNANAFPSAIEARRRYAISWALSHLILLPGTGAPDVRVLPLTPGSGLEERLAGELLLPLEALEDFVASDASKGAIERLCRAFGAEIEVAALQLDRSQAKSLLKPADRQLVSDVLKARTASAYRGNTDAEPTPWVRAVG
jgi:hypothetical protein